MSDLIAQSEQFVLNFLQQHLDTKYVYHNFSHTQRVVEKCKEIIENEELTSVEKENILIAAWFHDIGYVKGAENHEQESVVIAKDFLETKNIDADRVDEIAAIILVTKIGSKPKTTSQKVICDADCAHLASKDFIEYNVLLRKEWELTGYKEYSAVDWIANNIDFFTNHHKYYTAYALKNWEKVKQKNLAKLIKSKAEKQENSNKFKQKQEAIALKRLKEESTERGVETMFRVALRNHITLSDIADTKANILLSVNAIIISMTFSTLIPKLDNPSNNYLVYPSVIFIFFTVVCMILSILATRPNVTHGKFTKEDVVAKKVNLLFFGNFHKMRLDEFEWGIKEMMQDRDYLYGSLTKDLYFLGLVLNRKYGLLRITYTVFMVGILVSVTAFSLAFLLRG